VVPNWQQDRHDGFSQRPFSVHQASPGAQSFAHFGNWYWHTPPTHEATGHTAVPSAHSSHGAPGAGQSAAVVQLAPAAAAGPPATATPTLATSTMAAHGKHRSRARRGSFIFFERIMPPALNRGRTDFVSFEARLCAVGRSQSVVFHVPGIPAL
jgi:hypothetical protein